MASKIAVLNDGDYMRNNQVEIKISRFGDEVPPTYEKNGEHKKEQIIRVYADSNNLFEALSVAYSEAIKELQRHEKIPKFGCATAYNNLTNEFFCRP